MSTRTWITAGFLLASSALPARSWEVATCNQEHAAKWAGVARQMQEAKPGSPVFVPHPFPTTQDQVVENFLFQQKEIWSDLQPGDRPPEEQRFLSLIHSDHARYELTKVENWTPLRCGPERKRDFYFLLRVFDRESGIEVSRASLDDNGLLGALMHLPGGTEKVDSPRRFLDLTLARRFAASAGLSAEEPHYVTTYGTLRCHALSPCVAFRERGKVFLIETRGRLANLYRLELEKPRLSFTKDFSREERQAGALERLTQGGQELVSLGADALTTAVVVASGEAP